VILTLVTGLAYPLLVTAVSQLAFPYQANGSIEMDNGQPVGSELIGQPFSDPRYFWGRLSATPGFAYNPGYSTGSNLGPNNPELRRLVDERVSALRALDPNNTAPIPVDLVTFSGSGLDPHISVAAALYQVPRVAHFRNLSVSVVESVVESRIEGRTLGVLGEPRVNVLNLNRALDGLPATPAVQGGIPRETAHLLGIPIEGWIGIAVIIAVIFLLARPIGSFYHRLIQGDRGAVTRFLNAPTAWTLKAARVNEAEEMDWKTYATALLLLNAIGIAFLFALQLFQSYLPLNPQGFGPVSVDSSFNTAVSFGTNTNWQGYGGEVTMSHLTQMLGLTVQNFLSAATGLTVLLALTRGIARKTTRELGNFWADLIRSVYFLIPIALILALLLVSQGVPQTIAPSVTVNLLDPATDSAGALITTQTIPLGPVASQEAIKMLGTNGGGFFNANSAHPFENPTPFTNLLEMVAMLLVPVAQCVTYGEMVRDRRQGWALLAAMTILFLGFLVAGIAVEAAGNPHLAAAGADQVPTATNIGGNMEGKEVRFGVGASALWAIATTATSNGAVNSMHDSYTALGGMLPILNMNMGEVIFGGVGSGLAGMIAFVILANFIAGLMIGRIPEYLGNKLSPYDMKLAAAIFLLPVAIVLTGTAVAVSVPAGRAGIFNPGPHGFSEVYYAFSSASGNNGSAFAGIGANSPFYNFALGIAMLLSRYGSIILTLALASSLARKRTVPVSAGTLPTHRLSFVLWLDFVVLLLGALSVFPALAMGPIADHLGG
jgi:K+-transporting ATPase ATPase A chain